MDRIDDFVNGLNNILFSMTTVYALLVTGVIYTIWSVFGQYRALTHGVKVIRGAYDDKNDPGAINHFQALSAALSATVGLGNIAGVAVAVALGGPGAVFWMWVIGILGMALKMTEVTQSMLTRDTSDPENPKGGPMFVVQQGFASWGLKPLGTAIGGLFAFTVIISAITGGNMFQAWNVGDVTFTYFQVPQVVTGVILTVLVGLVIIGGIKRIGAFAGRIVPIMCGLYMLGAFVVLAINITEVPAMFGLIFKSAFSTAEANGAFLGGTAGYAAIWGIKRALFSSEAGQGSSPMAHSAAKTDEPVREGVVAGLEPFIDTIVVCTLTALVILSSGAYNRAPESAFASDAEMRIVQAPGENNWTVETGPLPPMTDEARTIRRTAVGDAGWRIGETLFVVVEADPNEDTGRALRRITGLVSRTEAGDAFTVNWNTLTSEKPPVYRVGPDGKPDLGIYGDYAGASMTAYAFDRAVPGLGKILVTIAAWLFALSTMISWSYYGEQAVRFLFGNLSKSAQGMIVFGYKIFYCLCILLTTVLAMPLFSNAQGDKRPILATDVEIDMWTTLGLGVMLVVNIPIMLLFGYKAMNAYHDYFRRMKAGGDDAHTPASLIDVAEGKDVQ
jgi:AGCS family alanine or glycine:cation symporter